jgi:hypothetical protein
LPDGNPGRPLIQVRSPKLPTVAAWSGDPSGSGVVVARAADLTRPVDELTHRFGIPAVATTTGGTR